MSDNKSNIENISAQDAFSNPIYRLGYLSQSPLEATQYPMTRLTQDHMLLNSLFRSSWIVQNIISMIPEDMTRKWYKLMGKLPGPLSRLRQAEQHAHLRQALTEGCKWGRLYGGAAGIILLRGQETRLHEPLDCQSLLPDCFQGLYIVDRWSGITPSTQLVTDKNDPDLGLPAWYDVRTPDGTAIQQVHHSKVIRFTGRQLPFDERVAEQYWGASEIEAIYEELVKRDNISHNMAALTFRACRDYLEMDNADQIFSIGGAEQQRRLWNVLQAQSVLDSNFGVRVVNKGDTMHNTQYSFHGLPDIYESVMLDVAGAARIPVTKLFGREPAGLNATGYSDLRNYYDYIDQLRESVLRPILLRLLPILTISAWGQPVEGLEISFDPLWTPTAAELAEITDKKTKAILQVFQAGLLDKQQAQKELSRLQEETGLFGQIPLEI